MREHLLSGDDRLDRADEPADGRVLRQVPTEPRRASPPRPLSDRRERSAPSASPRATTRGSPARPPGRCGRATRGRAGSRRAGRPRDTRARPRPLVTTATASMPASSSADLIASANKMWSSTIRMRTVGVPPCPRAATCGTSRPRHRSPPRRCPPCASTTRRVMKRPSPLPPAARDPDPAPHERVEDDLSLRERDARALVADAHPHGVSSSSTCTVTTPSGSGVEDRVPNQVHDRGSQVRRIPPGP